MVYAHQIVASFITIEGRVFSKHTHTKTISGRDAPQKRMAIGQIKLKNSIFFLFLLSEIYSIHWHF